MERIVFHIDVNNAFLSWEALYRLNVLGETLDLRTIPSAIGGDQESRHGIILAKSTEAKKFGIKTAEPLTDARKKCPNLHIVPPRMHIYREYSKKLISLLHDYSPIVEQYSIDEAFVDMSDIPRHSPNAPLNFANQIRQHIFDTLGFTVNIGVSSNKILAKMASDFEKPNKVHSLFPKEIPKKMWPLPVGELLFVGHATEKKLYNLGIRTIGELAQTSPSILQSHLGKHGLQIHNYANGIDNSPVNNESSDNKGYGNSTTLAKDVTTKEEAEKVLLSLCETVGTRLRKDSMLAGVVAVTIRYSDFIQESHQRTLSVLTNSTTELYHNIQTLFHELWNGSPIRLLGVSTSKLGKESMRQLNLLDGEFLERQNKLDNAIDNIRKKYGDDSIVRASSLTGTKNKQKESN